MGRRWRCGGRAAAKLVTWWGGRESGGVEERLRQIGERVGRERESGEGREREKVPTKTRSHAYTQHTQTHTHKHT